MKTKIPPPSTVASYIRARLLEPGTWAGLIGIVTGIIHVSVNDEQKAAVITAGIAIIGAIFAFLPNSLAATKTVALSDGTHATVEVSPEPAPGEAVPKVRALVLLALFPFAGPARADYEYCIPSDPSLATVRIGSHGGSGTIIATTQGRSWILSCAHMFTDRGMRPSAAARNKTLRIDGPAQTYLPAGRPGPASSRLVAIDYESDLSLIVLENGPCHYLPVDQVSRLRPQAWSCGYDEMRWPITKRPATVIGDDATTIYTREKPWHGRSGGGLIDGERRTLFGVVQGYGPTKGIYVSRARILTFIRANAACFADGDVGRIVNPSFDQPFKGRINSPSYGDGRQRRLEPWDGFQNRPTPRLCPT
jgi:hypothetical protein